MIRLARQTFLNLSGIGQHEHRRLNISMLNIHFDKPKYQQDVIVPPE